MNGKLAGHFGPKLVHTHPVVCRWVVNNWHVLSLLFTLSLSFSLSVSHYVSSPHHLSQNDKEKKWKKKKSPDQSIRCPCYKHSHYGWFQAIRVMSLNAELGRGPHYWLFEVHESLLQHPTILIPEPIIAHRLISYTDWCRQSRPVC